MKSPVGLVRWVGNCGSSSAVFFACLDVAPLPLSCLAMRRRCTRDDNLSIAITTVF